MRTAVGLDAMLLALVTGVASVGACSSGGGPAASAGTGGASGPAMGTGAAAGGGGTPTTGGSMGTGGAGGGLGTGGSGGASDASDTGGSAGGGGGGSGGNDASDTSGGSGDGAGEETAGADITKVLPTAGCGMDPGQAIAVTVRGKIQTMGIKPPGCADSRCGAWSYQREYFVTLPQGYDRTKAYSLIFQGPGCGSTGTAVYPLNNGVDNTAIRVGLTPPPDTIGHATNPNQGCFDDKEGDDSVDWVFYETLYDKLAGQLCFDRNRVFASGNSTGAWLSNEMGCKYAGDATHPVRGIMVNTGGLPTDPRHLPTCTDKPMAGMWVWEPGSDSVSSFSGNRVAIARAMHVNGCTIGTNVDNTTLDDFPIGGGNPNTTCQKIQGCPERYPLVVCRLPGTAQSSHDAIVNPGFSTFVKLFSTPPLLTP